ncbi:MAG TPA: RluA family pseudouridine synthase [Acidimicrobiia bacterium]|nr:RluA family pseudouridine synthase [Acidimicrobiia bacterium]
MSNENNLTFEIPEGMESLRADKAIALETHMSRSVIAELFAQGQVLLNGKAIKRSEKAHAGDVLEFEMPEEKIQEVVGQDIPLDIIFEDDHIVIVNKVQGMVVHPGAGNPDSTLVNALVFRYPDIKSVGQEHRPGIVHRLDSGTSGLLVAAKTNQAYEIFVDKFSRHDVTRDYVALVWGKFETSSGVIEAPIGRSTNRATKMAVRDDGKHAITHYSVDEYFEDKDVTLLDISLETGRTHQIRVHCAAINHPIVGDKTYGGYRQSLECPRPFLHAHTLKFEHPITGEKMEFTAGLPADLQDVLSRLEDV